MGSDVFCELSYLCSRNLKHCEYEKKNMFSDNAASNGAGADIGRMSASGRTELSAHQTVWTD